MAIPVLGFKSKKDCKAAIKAEVDPHRDTGKVFQSKLVARLFAERHYALSQYNISPVAFRWGTHPRFNTPECFYVCIEDPRFPNIWWRQASWNKAIDGWRLTDKTLNTELAEYFRRCTLPTVFEYRDRYMTCEFNGCTERYGLDVHHVDPNFKTIATGACALLTPDERAMLIATHDWFADNKSWNVPEKCIHYVEHAHKTAKLMLVCKQHHYQLEREQKGALT